MVAPQLSLPTRPKSVRPPPHEFLLPGLAAVWFVRTMTGSFLNLSSGLRQHPCGSAYLLLRLSALECLTSSA